MRERKVAVGRPADLSESGALLVEVDGQSIGLYAVDGRYTAVLNTCPHQLAPVCCGRVTGTTHANELGEHRWVREGEILVCPWHGREYDLRTGQALADRRRLRRFPVVVEDDTLWLILDGGPGLT